MGIQFPEYYEGLETVLSCIHKAGFPAHEEWSAKAFRDVLSLPTYDICIHVSDDDREKIQGFLLYSCLMDEAEIITFVVLPEARQKGIGKALLQDFLLQMDRQAVNIVFLEVAEDNSVARSLYRKTGFQEYGKRNHYYGQDRHAIIMRRISTNCKNYSEQNR